MTLFNKTKYCINLNYTNAEEVLNSPTFFLSPKLMMSTPVDIPTTQNSLQDKKTYNFQLPRPKANNRF